MYLIAPLSQQPVSVYLKKQQVQALIYMAALLDDDKSSINNKLFSNFYRQRSIIHVD